MATSLPGAQGPNSTKKKGRLGLGIVGALFGLGLIGSIGSPSTDTTPAADAHAAVTSASAPSSRVTEAPRPTTARSTASSKAAVATPLPPVPVMAMTCPAGGTVSSPVFGHQITATAPYSVVIDYGDGDVYTNDDQHLGAIFSHTYQRAGTFTVHALLTDATGQTVASTCAYSWTAPAPVVRSSSGTSGSSASGSGTGTGSSSASSTGDTYTNVDGEQVQRPVDAPSAPPGATAHCNDGTWSFSQHRQGTCSGHGGVAEWL
jgi:hypothetical protein